MRAVFVLVTLLLCAGHAEAQSMRPFSTFRQWHGETRLAARIEYAAGELRVGAGPTDELYHMNVSYDEDRFRPLSDYDASGGTVRLGVAADGGGGVRVISQHQLRQTAGVAFSPKADLSLDVQLGAVDGDLDLGGLRVTDLDLSAGASRAVVRFSRPNGTRCRMAKLSAGAAELSVKRARQQPLRPDCLRGRSRQGHSRFRRRMDDELSGRCQDGARRGDPPPPP